MGKGNQTTVCEPAVADMISGYIVKRVAPLDTIQSTFLELEHLETGAIHVHIHNKDAENAFSVAFKTVPQDSTGVAHILEHTVLCGSQKFPVRDPFFSMLKRSLSTFMNAFTASDWTMYPFATQNRKDYYNLMDVYLDAAFFPKLDELSFKQEGHRLAIESDREKLKNGRLVYKGVVYNEMKGAMSSPDQVMAHSILNALYPQTTYRFNSGGDPAEIPTLTYDQLRRFHRRHYHPSNAFFYSYGNLPIEDTLSFIQEKVLGKYRRIDPDTVVARQPRWTSPQRVTYYYPLEKQDITDKKSQVCVAWLTDDIRNTKEVIILTILEQVLLGNPASPLRKALMDSGMGSALSDGTGFDADNRDTFFACGLKDVAAIDASRIEKLVLDTLSGLVTDGIDDGLIASAIHQLEFHKREITNTPYPYGLNLLLQFCGSWFHGADPMRTLHFDQDLATISETARTGPFFENKIIQYLLDNTHRVTLTLEPDPDVAAKEDARVAVQLQLRENGMSPDEFHQLADDAKALERLQDGKEDLVCLPTLELTDIPVDIEKITESARFSEIPAVFYESETSGIFYFCAAAGCGRIEVADIPLVPFFCFAITRIGTGKRDFAEMAKRIDQYTGGIGFGANAHTAFTTAGSCLPFVSVNGKCLNRNVDRMFDIVQELVCAIDFRDQARLKSLLLEYRAMMESSIVNNGHRLAISLAARNLSPARYLTELWSGVHQIKTLKNLTTDLSEARLSDLSIKLMQIADVVFSENRMEMASIGEAEAIATASGHVMSLIDRTGTSRGKGAEFTAPPIYPGDGRIREGWGTSSQVSFVASARTTVRMDHPDAPVLAVLAKLLRSLYLHREIREKGGAYGGFALYNPEDAVFSFGSYRDPHILSTLAVYEKASHFLRAENYSDEDIKEAILQVCSEIDKPDPPGPAARKAFYRKLIGLSDEQRKGFKDRLLSVTRDRVATAGRHYFPENQAEKNVAVISNESKLLSANDRLGQIPLNIYRI